MIYNDFLIFYLLLLIALHFIYLYYMLNFILNSIIISNSFRTIHDTSYNINYTTSIFINNTIPYYSIDISRLLFNTTL